MSSFLSDLGEKSISNIFVNMALGAEPVNINLAEDWLKANMPGGEIPDEVLFLLEEQRQCESTVNLIPALQKFTNLLQENRSLLISMLVHFKYTWNDANTIVSMFINELKSYDVLVQNNLAPFQFSDFYLSTLEFSEECRNIARNLYCGNYIVRLCAKSDPLVPVYCLLAKLCAATGLKERISVQFFKEEGKLRKYLDDYNNIPCPMIITEDADLDSAVEALAESACQFQREVSWSVSHVFIQESKFEVAVSLLQERIQKIVYGSRSQKSTELQSAVSKTDLTEEKCKNLKIFKPFNESPIKICIGWSPNDIDGCQTFNSSNGYIVVVPYRNYPDLQALLKENIGSYCRSCSVWSEKFSVKKVLSLLECSTCWINCHGLIHPLVPFNSLPTVVQILESVLNNDIDPSNKFTEIARSDDTHLSRCFPSALLSAIKGFKEWQKFKIGDKLKLLTKIKTFSSCHLNSQEECCKLAVEQHVIKDYIDEMIGFPSRNCDFNLKLSPIGVIIFYLNILETTPVGLNRLKRLIAYSLYHGNAVVVHSDPKYINNLKNLKNEMSAMLETPIIKQTLNFVTDFNEDIEKSKVLINKELSSGPCPYSKVIIIGDSSWSDHTSVRIALSDSSLDEYRAITALTTLSKSIWTNV